MRAGAEQGLTKDDIGLYVLGDDAQGDSIMWLSHSIRRDSKHFHMWITIYPLEIKDIALANPFLHWFFPFNNFLQASKF